MDFKRVLLLTAWFKLAQAQLYTLKPRIKVDDAFFRTYQISSTTREIIQKTDPDALFFGKKKSNLLSLIVKVKNFKIFSRLK